MEINPMKKLNGKQGKTKRYINLPILSFFGIFGPQKTKVAYCLFAIV